MIKLSRKEIGVTARREINFKVFLRAKEIIDWINQCDDPNDLWLLRKCIYAKVKIMKENGIEFPEY